MLAGLFALAPLLCAQGYPPPGSDWVLPLGTSNFHTAHGPLKVHSMTVPQGAFVRVQGDDPFIVLAETFIEIEGTIDASGFSSKSVFSLLVDLPEPGALGGPGGGTGGMGYPGEGQVVLAGGTGTVVTFPDGLRRAGGGGGETGFGPNPIAVHHRGGGGGGGAFAQGAAGGGADLAAARGGAPGDPLALGAWSGLPRPAGGAAGTCAFSDGDPFNDFFGLKLDPATGTVMQGELARLRGGGGGGGAGESVALPFLVPTVPTPIPGPYRFFRNGGGGGGGGILVLASKRIRLGPEARLLADGGKGHSGGLGLHGAASGGGSGGLLMLDAPAIDLRSAGPDVLSARGGLGGTVEPGGHGAGGDGGPGLLQLHIADPATGLLLPLGTTLADLSTPDAHVLLPLDL